MQLLAEIGTLRANYRRELEFWVQLLVEIGNLRANYRRELEFGVQLLVEIGTLRPNGDSWSTYERGPSWLVSWARRAGTRDSCPAFFFSPVACLFKGTVA